MNKLKNIDFIVIMMLVPFFIFFGSLFGGISERFISAREDVNYFQINSENLRIVFPYLTAMDVLRSSPIFGVGISGKELIGSFSTLNIDPSDAFGNNNFAALFIYLGFFGTFLFARTFYLYLSRHLLSYQLPMIVILILSFAHMGGGFESPRFWGYIFIFIGVLGVQARTYRGLNE